MLLKVIIRQHQSNEEQVIGEFSITQINDFIELIKIHGVQVEKNEELRKYENSYYRSLDGTFVIEVESKEPKNLSHEEFWARFRTK